MESENVQETVPVANLEAPITSPTGLTHVSQQWLIPYLTTSKGLPALLKQLLRNPDADLVQVFVSTFKAVYIKTTTAEDGTQCNSFLYPDEVGLFECYQKWQDIANNKEAQSADINFAKEMLEAKMQRIFKDIYYLEQVELPSLVFCGCVDVLAMQEGQPFRGYNERDLSIREARDLKAKIQRKYEGVGQETIFLMLKQPIQQSATQLNPAFQPPPEQNWTVAAKRQLLNDFAARQFETYLDVDQVMIPCCGKPCSKKCIFFHRIPKLAPRHQEYK